MKTKHCDTYYSCTHIHVVYTLPTHQNFQHKCVQIITDFECCSNQQVLYKSNKEFYKRNVGKLKLKKKVFKEFKIESYSLIRTRDPTGNIFPMVKIKGTPVLNL